MKDTGVYRNVLNHIHDYAIVLLNSRGNVVFYNNAFLILFDFDANQIINKPLPKNISDLLNSTSGTTAITGKYGEKITVSHLVSYLNEEPESEILRLIMFKDLTHTELKKQLKNTVLKIAHIVNCSEDADSLCEEVLRLICESIGTSAAFICLVDTVNRTFTISSQTNLNELYPCHNCNYCSTDSAVPANKISCFNSYSSSTISSSDLLSHSLSRYVNGDSNDIEKSSIIHIPLLSDNSLLGLLHIIGPTSITKTLLCEEDILKLISSEITVGINRIKLVREIKQYADNLEKIIKIRTDQLREKDVQLVQSGKLATLGELATGIAHEINQPLGGISLITQGLIMAKTRDKLPDALLMEKLSDIVKQVDRINNIITHLRTFAHQTDNIKGEVDVRMPLLDVFKLIGQQLVNREIDVILDIDEEIPIILADHNRLEQVFLNIISNARDALDDMENAINALNRENKLPNQLKTWKKRLLIRVFREHDKLVLEFIDNGIGVPKSIINKIFEPFFTTKEVGKGTGLGLSITYGIVRDFNGIIETESEEMKGSKFIFKFPVYK